MNPSPADQVLPTSTTELLAAWMPSSRTPTNSSLAAALNLSQAAVSNWFSRASSLNWSDIARIDDALAAEGAFEDFLRALTTPNALEPDTVWRHNPGGTGPHWAWIRPAGDDDRPFMATVRIGPFAADYTPPPGRVGGIIWSAAAPVNPATQIELSRPGWVDFGRGRVPGSLGVSVTDIVEATRFDDPGHDHAFGVGIGIIERAGRHRPRWLLEVADATGAPVELLREAVQYVKTMTGSAQQVQTGPIAQPSHQWDGPSYAVLREQRRYSQRDVVSILARDRNPLGLGRSALDRFENGANVRVPLLAARLDRLYQGDGRTGYWPVPVAAGEVVDAVEFPSWWVGPVWLSFRGPGSGRCTLEWAPWRKPLQVASGGVVEIRRSSETSEPLTVHIPSGWVLTAGIGRHPAAVDANEHWLVMKEAVQQFFQYYFDVTVRAAGGSVQKTMQLLSRNQRL